MGESLLIGSQGSPGLAVSEKVSVISCDISPCTPPFCAAVPRLPSAACADGVQSHCEHRSSSPAGQGAAKVYRQVAEVSCQGARQVLQGLLQGAASGAGTAAGVSSSAHQTPNWV